MYSMVLFSRRTENVKGWLRFSGLSDRHAAYDYQEFNASEHFDVIINFVGAGNPAQVAAMGASIFDVTLEFDGLALRYLNSHPDCRYLFLSSGAAYGGNFSIPVDEESKSEIQLNNFQPKDYYSIAKLYTECRHRALPHLSIIDIRVFNYFSHTQDIDSRFLITDILRSIINKTIFETSGENIVRDFLNPVDFSGLVNAILTGPRLNTSVDCYTKAPIDKYSLLFAMREKFKLEYIELPVIDIMAPTALKSNYYSLNRRAHDIFGYNPLLTSLDGILREVEIILKKYK